MISASLLNADASRFGKTCRKLEACNVDMLHFDVMDGVFVDNISFGVPILSALDRCSDMFMDVHLMIVNPYKYITVFAENGADLITFHYESKCDIIQTINLIHSLGKKAGISVKPDTPVECIFQYVDKVEQVLIMTVEPGFGGQGFIPETVPKIRKLREYITANSLNTDIEVDGGINNETAAIVSEAGANVLVSGSYLFKSDDMMEAVESLRL